MTTVYLVRHGEAEGNIYRRLHGQYNGDLTENGLRQVEYLERRFRPIHLDAVYSSDLRRCVKTARALYEHKGLPLQLEPGLREMAMGDWEDKPWGELGRTHPEEILLFRQTSRDFCAPGGERFGQVRDRVADTILRLAGRHDGETIALSTHFLAMRSALSRFHHCSVEEINQIIPKCDNTGVTCLRIQGEDVKILYECDSSHLPESLSTIGRQSWKRNNNVADPETNLWYRPWEPEGERALYLRFREEAWHNTHPNDPFDAEGFYKDAWNAARENPWSVVCVMQGDRIAGLLQMDLHRYEQDGSGFIYFYYLIPALRCRGLGVQLLGQAVHTFRPLGRSTLRLRCSPDNQIGLHFYGKYGFYPIGADTGSSVPLLVLEKRIDEG
jgi:probable phosphoglycerate mutase